jgi:tetratricopeptide (TPR) repeat protein
MASARPLEIFYSYAHEDEKLRDKLEKHLSQLKRQGVISDWHDRDITAGSEWKNEIDKYLESAQIILLLISPDFLASDYCHDVEMTRAMERHHNQEAQVIPIILRPVDWERAPFSKLQCLPRNAEPVTLWKNEDAAFRDVAKGIRKVTEEIRIPPPHLPLSKGEEGWGSESKGEEGRERKRQLPVLRFQRYWRWVLMIVTGLLILSVVGGFIYYDKFKQHFSDGRYFLNIGRYAEAKQAFQQALDLLAISSEAQLGLEKASVFDHSDREVIERNLKQLEKKNPTDSDVQVLLGRFYAAQNELPKAIQYYQTAIKQDSDAAEAYFGLGVVYDQQGRSSEAMEMFRKAVNISGSSPRYVNNLAYLYAQQKNYDEALRLYGKLLQNFPIASLETAHIYRLTGRLEQAWRLQEYVVGSLDNPDIMRRPENQEPWYYKTDREAIILADPVDKKCYVYYSLAATLFLDNHPAEAEAYVNKARKLRGAHQPEIRALVGFDLKRLVEERTELEKQVNAFRQQLLKIAG